MVLFVGLSRADPFLLPGGTCGPGGFSANEEISTKNTSGIRG